MSKSCVIVIGDPMSTEILAFPEPKTSTNQNTAMSHSNELIDQLLAKAAYSSSGIGTNLHLHLARKDEVLVLHITGSSSDSLPESFTGAVEQVLAALRPAHAAVDLSNSQSLPSVILAFLVFFQKNAEANGAGKVILFGANTRILTVIKMIGMLDFFIIKQDADAMKAFISARA